MPPNAVLATISQTAEKKKAALGGFLLTNSLGWLMGLEPTTTGITILRNS